MARSSALPIDPDVPAFDVVDAVTPVGAAPCAECRGAIVDTYYEADERVICASCHALLTSGESPTAVSGSFTRALGFGVLAAAAAAASYVALLATTGRELTLALFFVGLVVGKSVRTGARGHGGRRFQWLAVVLTYLAVATTYVPFVVKGYSRVSFVASGPTTDASFLEPSARFLTVAAAPVPAATTRAASLGGAAVGFGALLLLAVAAPMLESANNLVATLVLVAAIIQAWRMNRRVDRTITGPYRVRGG